MFSFHPYSRLYEKAFSLNLHFPLIFFPFLKRPSKRFGLVFLLLGCAFQINFTAAKNYTDQIRIAQEKTGNKDAVKTIMGKINGLTGSKTGT